MTVLSKRLVPAIVATAAPGTTDDASKGYKVGMWWFDATHTNIYWCKANTIGSADWENVTGGGGGSGTVIGAADAAGTGVSVYDAAGSDASIIAIRTLLAGTDITITDNGDGTITIDSTGGGGGGGKSVSSYQATVAAESALVAYWKCNDAYQATTLVDSASGAANPMAINASYMMTGIRSLIQTGLETAANCITPSTNTIAANVASPTGAIPINAAARSLELIFRTTGTTFTVFAGWGSAGTRNWFGIGCNASSTGTLFLGVYGDDIVLADHNILDGWPHHVALTYDGATTLKAYLDGKLVNTHTLGAALTTTLTGDGVQIGTGKPFGSTGYPGQISDVAIYNTDISGATILDHYKRLIGAL